MPLDFAAIMQAAQNTIPDQLEQNLKRAQTDALRVKSRQDQAELDDRDQFVRDVVALGRNPTAANISALQARYPKQHEGLKAAWGTMYDDHRQTNLTAIGSILSRVRAGDREGALRIAKPWHDADIGAGTVDETDKEVMRVLEHGTPLEMDNLKGLLTASLATTVGPDKVGDFWADAQNDQRNSELHPSKMVTAEAEARTKTAEAESASDYYTARSDKEQSEATTAKSNSLWADLKNRLGTQLSTARLANVRSIIVKRARELGKAPEDVTDEELAGPIHRKGGKVGGVSAGEADTLGLVQGRGGGSRPKYIRFARDANGRQMGFNPKSRKWEMVQ